MSVCMNVSPSKLYLINNYSTAANVSDAEYRRYSTFLQGAAPKLWPAPKEGMWFCLLSIRKKMFETF